MLNYSKVLIDSIEREQKGLDYICPKADRELLHKLLDEINIYTGTNYHYLAELDAFNISGAGSIVAKYITEFSSEGIKGYLIPQMVSDKIKDCDKLVFQLYMHFRLSEEYIAKPGEPAPAHIYVRYDNAFKNLKPKMLASWKLPEMKNLLLSYAANDSISAQDVGIHDGEQVFFPSVESIKRELTFTAINGLKYYPSAEVTDVITSLTSSSDKDIKLAAKRSLMALTK